MVDVIQGKVTEVIDGDTFEMNVTGIGQTNSQEYNDIERIRIAGMNAPELGTQAGQQDKQNLENQIGGKIVKCEIKARDQYGRLVSDVSIV